MEVAVLYAAARSCNTTRGSSGSGTMRAPFRAAFISPREVTESYAVARYCKNVHCLGIKRLRLFYQEVTAICAARHAHHACATLACQLLFHYNAHMNAPYTKKTAAISFRLDAQIKADVEALARRENRSTANYLESLLKQHVNQKRKKPRTSRDAGA